MNISIIIRKSVIRQQLLFAKFTIDPDDTLVNFPSIQHNRPILDRYICISG